MSIQRSYPPSEVIWNDFETVAGLLKAVADSYRLTMLAMLAAAAGEVCVCDFTAALPLNQPTVSHHLRILREAELVISERRGTWVYYHLAPRAHERVRAALASAFEGKGSPVSVQRECRNA
ncbi:transcriptional regulator [bacterium]|nr:MAG: transcriptional regulator [bacterium]